jgi:hypothetical protein
VVVSAALTARRGHKKAGGATQEIVINFEFVNCVRQSVVEARAAECGVEARAVVECAALGCLGCMGDERVESSTAPARWPTERSTG